MANSKQTLGSRLNGLLRNATAANLDGVDAEIAAAEARVRSLKAVREFLAEEVLNRPPAGKAPPRTPAAAPSGTAPAADLLARIGAFLAEKGPTSRSKLIKAMGSNMVAVGRVLNGNGALFDRDEAGDAVSLTSAGHQRFTGKDDEE